MNEILLKSKETLRLQSDEEIINEVKWGNKEYFAEIIKRYNQRLYRIAISFGIDDDDCDEVLQLTYISAYEKLSQFRGDARFFTWLTRILINECLMLKRKNKKVIHLTEDKAVTISDSVHLNPIESLMEKERKEILENAIRSLPEKYKSVYMLKEVEGLSVLETSEVLAISEVNVKVRLHRARSMLKNVINEVADVSTLFSFGNERCDRINNKIMDYIRKQENET